MGGRRGNRIVIALDAQRTAARPDASTWVSANAGSGKTRVLTDRVARLLLQGSAPQKILCLTYTKAAAAEMQTRLFRTLGGWAMMPEPALRDALAGLGEDGATPAARLDAARTLFASALETPGGLKIQTIHAFCDGLLRRFPLEAGVAPQFTLLEDRQARALRAETLDDLAASGSREFADLAVQLSGDDADPLLREINRHRELFATPFDRLRLAAALGADPDLTPEADLRRGDDRRARPSVSRPWRGRSQRGRRTISRPPRSFARRSTAIGPTCSKRSKGCSCTAESPRTTPRSRPRPVTRPSGRAPRIPPSRPRSTLWPCASRRRAASGSRSTLSPSPRC